MTGQDLQKAQDWTSRKYRAAWILTFIFVGLLVIPAVTSLLLTIFWKEITFSILPIGAFVTFVSLIWAAYFGANVTEKHNSFSNKTTTTNLLDEVTEDEGDGFGGQPPEANNP
jgi:hypothetical protein